MALDKTKIKLVDYDLYVEGIGKIGYLVRAQTRANPGAQYTKVENAAQFRGVIKAWKVGDAPTLTTTLLQSDFEVLFGELGSGQYSEIVSSGGDKAYGLGNKIKDLEQVGVFIRLHPTSSAEDDFSADIAFWKAAPDFSNVEIAGDLDNPQTVTVPWLIMPDESKDSEEAYGRIGDWSIVDGTPLGVFIQLAPFAKKPYKHIPAVSLGVSAKANAYAYAFKATVGATDIGALNGAITATSLTFNVNGLPPNHPIGVGDYIRVTDGTNTEYMEITGATIVTATEKTFTVIRAVGGSLSYNFASGDPVRLLSKVAVQRGTEAATWSSSVPANIVVGNSNTLGNKGELRHGGSAGTSNVTATINTVASPNLVATSL